jgi:hypothetical protein
MTYELTNDTKGQLSDLGLDSQAQDDLVSWRAYQEVDSLTAAECENGDHFTNARDSLNSFSGSFLAEVVAAFRADSAEQEITCRFEEKCDLDYRSPLGFGGAV